MSLIITSRIPGGSIGLGAITNANVAVAGLAPEKRRGFKFRQRATLVAGTVTVTPGTTTTAVTDVWEIDDSTTGGTPEARSVNAITAGAAGVGNFDITSQNVADTSDVAWIQYDNTYIG
jgi:hypothetical protein